MVDLRQAVEPDLRPVGVAPSVLSRLLRGNELELKKSSNTHIYNIHTPLLGIQIVTAMHVSWVWYLGVLREAFIYVLADFVR